MSTAKTPSLRTLIASFSYFDVLRETGVTNMYAAAPYLMRDLGRSRDHAVKELTMWRRSFSKEEPETRARAALLAEKEKS